ncbi:Dol-P-Glc:Glc(2)Man(9)GlcNAc(2)-PP-Dol alpha-1-2-glucosyltransferase [Apiospora rasikravindrae]|uniref:Dol-P-Glc:Glc(2)Man(9)GlcNAc(2)-PP-Dol alpha-1,2-glucosyltransferase n=1 Tax=Apiospora rasikravindrae TaxID=990691 RepID=A0ABR1TWB3_9PEZI
MEFLTEVLDLVLSQKFLLLASSGVFAITLGRLCELNTSVLVKFGLFNSILILFATLWLSYVNATVPSPYLVYCQGKYSQWDDKITTPPGLYLAAIAWARLVGKADCSAQTLRQFNVVAIFWTSLFAAFCQPPVKGDMRLSALRSNFALHSGLNIALFPVLFFFSGLFYTDVLSTCIVLAAYSNHSARVSSRTEPPSFLNDLYTIALGVCALCMRQTNVFWVVVYMGGLEAVAALKSLNQEPADAPFTATNSQFQLFPPKYTPGHVYDPSVGGEPEFFPWRYTLGEVYDPPVGDAWPGDLALCVLSLACAAWWNLFTMLRRIYPHIITLSLFVAFVVWNGGVVLGDKSNHVATLHAAQMLYIWPLFAFFSAPLFLPQVIRCLDAAYRFITKSSASSSFHLESSRRSEKKEAALVAFNAVFSNGPLLSVLLMVACLMVGLAIVHFNTIIHPFTLADNRHYMFYVFRYSILRGSVVRHALQTPKPASNVPRITISVEDKVESFADRFATLKDEVSQSPPASNVVILLLTTALSLMTAPLVEPRYFILPWVFWRLLVPAWSMDDLLGTHQAATDKPSSILLVRVFNRYDIRLVLESIWFLLINVATMYIFLTRPFHWKAEDGTLLDSGNVQRFMW